MRPGRAREANRSIRRGVDAARDWGHEAVGSEHLLVGIARGHGPGADLLAALGVSRDAVEDEVRRRIAGRGEDPEGPDPVALASLGIDVDRVRSAGDVTAGTAPVRRRRTRLTPEARVAIEAAVPVATDRRDRRLTSAHLLAGLVVSRASRARDVLDALEVGPADVLAALPRPDPA